MWIVRDELGREVSKSFYKRFAKKDGGSAFEKKVLGTNIVTSENMLPVKDKELWPLAVLHGWTIEKVAD